MTDQAFRYSVQLFGRTARYTPAAWRVRRSGQFPGNGRPTEANLARYVADFEASTDPGGPNAHLGPSHITRAVIRDYEAGGAVIARYAEAAFEVAGEAVL